MTKRGIFFSTDALLALAIILIIVLIAFPLIKDSSYKSNLHYDIINSLETAKVGDLDVPEYLITDPGNSVLEQIGYFYARGDTSLARELADISLSSVNINENLGLWYENTLIWAKNSSPYNEEVKKVDVARQVISGIQNGTNITGFSARAHLANNILTNYFYFGGYIGDGNLSAPISYTGNITSADLEIAINKDFDLYINEIFTGTYSKSPSETTPS